MDNLLNAYLIFAGSAVTIGICAGLYGVIKGLKDVSSKTYNGPSGVSPQIYTDFDSNIQATMARDIRRQKELAELARTDRITGIDRWKT